MLSGFKISSFKLFLSGLLFVNSTVVFSINDTLYLCKGNGIRYKTIDDPNATEFSNAWKWTFEGGDIASSVLKTTEVVTYNTPGKFKTYNETFFPTFPVKYDTFLVIVYDWPIPPFYFQADTGYCAGSSFSIQLKASTFRGVTYKWNTGDTSRSITVNTKGTYWVDMVIRSDGGNCDSIRRQVNIAEYTMPTVNLGQDQLMCQSQIILLDAKGSPGDTYLWTPNNETTKQISVSLPGTYGVQITTPDNCKATDVVELIDSCPHLIFIPNAVSPNTDLLNDFFDKSWNFTPKEYTFCIYDRWGELLFQTNDTKQSWDCKFEDKTVQQDVYVYTIVFLDTDKKWYSYRGTFFVDR